MRVDWRGQVSERLAREGQSRLASKPPALAQSIFPRLLRCASAILLVQIYAVLLGGCCMTHDMTHDCRNAVIPLIPSDVAAISDPELDTAQAS